MEGLIRNGLEGSIWAEEFSLENLLQKKNDNMVCKLNKENNCSQKE